jgi:hypothetical protein
MSKRKYPPPIRLLPLIYEAWLKENPKMVDGGPLVLISNENTDSDDENIAILPNYKMESEILPPHYTENLIIHGHSTQYEGFNLWVTVIGFDYLLMAHKTHYGDPFITVDGKTLGDHPHFHELDYYKPERKGRPATRYQVNDSLNPCINSAELLEAFTQHYYIDDGRTENVKLPDRPLRKQKGLDDFT